MGEGWLATPCQANVEWRTHKHHVLPSLAYRSQQCALLACCFSATQEAKALKKAGFKDGEALKKSSAKFMSFFQVGCDSPAN